MKVGVDKLADTVKTIGPRVVTLCWNNHFGTPTVQMIVATIAKAIELEDHFSMGGDWLPKWLQRQMILPETVQQQPRIFDTSYRE